MADANGPIRCVDAIVSRYCATQTVNDQVK